MTLKIERYADGQQTTFRLIGYFLVLAMAAFLMIRGAGALAVDRAFTRVARSNKAPARLAHS